MVLKDKPCRFLRCIRSKAEMNRAKREKNNRKREKKERKVKMKRARNNKDKN